MSAIVYLLQISACMGIFYSFYYFMLNRLTFFTINRWYLMATLFLSFAIPLLTIPVQHERIYLPVIQQAVYVNELQSLPVDVPLTIAETAPIKQPINWMSVLKMLYLVAVIILFIRLMVILMVFFAKIKRKKSTRIGRIHILQGSKDLNNGSFLNYIFLNDDELSPEEIQQIIAHEMLHVRLYHSVDRIAVKISQIILWFNPFVYLYARAIEENHEFEVDREISNATDKSKYAELLLHLSVAGQGTLYHNFSMVPLKKRITMLFTKPSNHIKKVIYVLVLPVVMISCLAFARLKVDKTTDTEMHKDVAHNADTLQSKLKPAQLKSQEDEMRAMKAFAKTPEGKKKDKVTKDLMNRTLQFKVLDNYFDKTGEFKGVSVKCEVNGYEYVLLSWYGQEKALNNMLKKGDNITLKVFSSAYAYDNSPVTIIPAYVMKDGKKIFQLAEADKIPTYPFLYDANKVRYADGQVSNIVKYPNGKWKTALFETVNGYKFNLSFKSTAPAMAGIEWGDRIRLRFVHEVKAGAKTYNINDWVAITTDVKDYGIKNPEWFNKFYTRVPVKTIQTATIKDATLLEVKAPTVKINGDAPVEAVFAGKVNSISSVLGKILVIVQHGEYFAAYANLKSVSVTRGQEIDTKQTVGTADIDARTGTTAMHFELYKGKTRITGIDQIKIETDKILQVGKNGMSHRLAMVYSIPVGNKQQYSVIRDLQKMGPNPLVLIDNVEHTKDILYRISSSCIKNSATFPRNRATAQYGKKAKDGVVVINTKEGKITDITPTERENLVKEYAVANKFYARVRLRKENGEYFDKAIIKLASGSGAAADLATDGRIGFIVKNKLYNESDFKRLFPRDNASFGNTISVGGPSPKQKMQGFDVNGYDLIFQVENKTSVGLNDQHVKTGIKTLQQILPEIPGLTVRTDGTLWANNNRVTGVKINGRDYRGGDLKQAMASIPADMIDHVVIDSSKANNSALDVIIKPNKH